MTGNLVFQVDGSCTLLVLVFLFFVLPIDIFSAIFFSGCKTSSNENNKFCIFFLLKIMIVLISRFSNYFT